MIPVSTDYKRQLIAGNRNWLIKIPVYLKGNVTNVPDFTLENQHIWDNGIVLDNATSNDSEFDIGAAIIGSLKVVIDNIHGNFSTYDFYDAKLTLYLGVQGDVDESDVQRYYRIGSYVVDQPDYNGSLITLNCLDNMTWFDVPFENITTTGTTAGQLVQDICTKVGVFLSTPQFPNYTTAINVTLEQKLNCREVLQYVAQVCCCYCKIDRAGELALAWYDKSAIIGITDYDGGTFSTTTTPYSDGCDLDGGSFNPWTGGDIADGGTFSDLLNGAWLTQNFEMSVSTDDIVVTGCRVRNTSKKDNAYDELWVDSTLEQTHDRYVLVIDNNPLITTQAQASTIANTVGAILAGLPIRGYTATSLADFSFETGDMVTIIDFRGNLYRTWITHFTFTTNNSERFSCGVQSLRQRSEERFSQAIQTLAEANDNASAMLSSYDSAQAAMNELAQEALGYYVYQHTVTGGGMVTWLYNIQPVDTTTFDDEHPLFPNATVIFKISGDGVFISDGTFDPDTGEQIYTQGYDANSGTAILNMIYAHGISCDWIHAGTLKLGGDNNADGVLEIYANDGVSLIGKWDRNGINATTGTFSGTLQAARGTLSDGSGTLSLESGSLKMTKDTSDGAGIFAYGSSNYSCWGATNSAALASGAYRQVPTMDVIRAGENVSDRRKKTKIKDISVDFAKRLILGIKPKEFRFKKYPDELQFGVIAQDVQKIEEECGVNEKNRLFYIQDDGTYSVEYRQLIAPMIKVIQEQQKEIELLKKKVGM